MRIAIIGAGNVGGGLGAACAAVGHGVVFGVRDPASLKTMLALAAVPDATAETPAAAVEGADVVAVALRWNAVPATIETPRASSTWSGSGSRSPRPTGAGSGSPSLKAD